MATLKELSDEATQGEWGTGDIVEGQLIGQWVGLGPMAGEDNIYAFMAVDANFIVALVNAFRRGELVEIGQPGSAA